MQCVILAGGLGTRMGRWTVTMPKALVPVQGEPFLRHQLRLLDRMGIDDVVILTGYKSEMIEAEVVANSVGAAQVRCFADGETLLGTAGAVRRAVEAGLIERTFLLTYGDSYLSVDHRAVFESFRPDRYDALMTVNPVDDREPANARYANGVVELYRKGANDPAAFGLRHVDYGLSVLSRTAVVDSVVAGASADLVDLFETLSTRGRLQGYETAHRYQEIGSERGLAELEARLTKESTTC